MVHGNTGAGVFRRRSRAKTPGVTDSLPNTNSTSLLQPFSKRKVLFFFSVDKEKKRMMKWSLLGRCFRQVRFLFLRLLLQTRAQEKSETSLTPLLLFAPLQLVTPRTSGPKAAVTAKEPALWFTPSEDGSSDRSHVPPPTTLPSIDRVRFSPRPLLP